MEPRTKIKAVIREKDAAGKFQTNPPRFPTAIRRQTPKDSMCAGR